jgi:beta-aspartyl-dipeptidase (metallo-type)
MLCGYYGVNPLTITSSVINDMVCVDKVLGCKLAISDVRADYPTILEVLRLLKQVRVGGMISGKSGILHIHLGALDSKMEMLLDIVKLHQFPIKHISPTHVGRTEELFMQAVEFAMLGGIMDISSGGTKFTDPHKQVMIALEAGVSIDNITISSDGNGGVSKLDDNGNVIGFRRAPFHLNLEEVRKLIKLCNLDISDAIKIITSNPARNLSLKSKGSISPGSDADFCFFDDDFVLTDVIARGEEMMIDGKIVRKSSFE